MYCDFISRNEKKSDQDKCFLKIMLFFVFFDELGFAEILVKEIVNAFTDSKIYLILPHFCNSLHNVTNC